MNDAELELLRELYDKTILSSWWRDEARFRSVLKKALPRLLDEIERAHKERDETRAEVERLRGVAVRIGVLAGDALKIVGPTDLACDMVAELARICEEV